METVILKYYASGVTTAKTMQMLAVRGINEPDEIERVPGLQFITTDGSVVEFIKGFRRVITLEIGVLSSESDRDFILAFLGTTYRAVNYAGKGDVFLATKNPKGFANEFRNGLVVGKYYSIILPESSIWTDWPEIPVSTVDIMYIKLKVKIDGTQAAPEYFETNSGKLQYNYGTTPFPSISLLSYIVSIDCDGSPYQDTHFNQVGDVVQVGGNVGFYLAQSGGGAPSGDGNCYADILIRLQEII